MVITTDSQKRLSVYSWYNIVEKYSESAYVNQCLLGGYMQENIKKVLVIGAGWGAFIKHLEDHTTWISITGIDIDETMLKIAQNELFIKTKDLIIWDAISVLDNLPTLGESYDLILFDIYNSAWEIPTELTQSNIFENIKWLLKSSGIFALNYSNFDIHSKKELDISRVEYYRKIHSKIQNIFGKEFVAFLSWKRDGGNVSGIYNLDKKYSKEDFLNHYHKKIENGKIIFDPMIVKGVYLDERKEFLK